MNLSDVLLHPAEYDGDAVAAPWRWLLPGDFSVLHVTVFGNLFLVDGPGRVWLLDSWSGELHGVSPSYEEYKLSAGTDADFFRSWFLEDFVSALVEAGLERPAGHVFGPLVSPGLGGSLSPANFSLAPLMAYVAVSAEEAKLQRHGPGR